MTSDDKDGGPAFAHGDRENGGHPGMTLRDWFAGQALEGYIARSAALHPDIGGKCYEYADKMLEARKRS